MRYFFQHLIEEFQLPLKNPVLVFSILLFIILLSPIVLRKMKIPGIIGLILSGVLIGPHGLGLIGSRAMEAEGSIKLFSTIGLLYIMFMAGLELDLRQFKRYFNKSIGFGLLTFFIPLALGYPLCREVLHLSPLAALLTASMFSTHTLVAYPIVSKFGLTKHPAVAITVGGTILTDTAVLIILAIISSAAQGDLDFSFWVRLLTSLLMFSLIMFFVIPRIARWFFSKLDSEKTSQYIFVLSVVFFSAFLAEVAGVEHIIGAFVAGLVLNKLIPHHSTLMNRIDFIGNSLFIPFFLIFVGMIVDLKAFTQGTWPLLIAGILTSFALFSKWLSALISQLIFKLSANERQIIFGLSSARAAATLAIISVGYNVGLLNVNIVNGTVVLILITTMASSMITENSGKRLLLDISENSDLEDNEMRLRNKHLVVSMNALEGNERLLDFALLVSDPQVINPISVVSVYPDNENAERMIRKSRKSLEEIIKHYSGHEAKLNTIATIDHNLSSGISRVSKELVADIVLVNDSKQINLIKRMVGDDREHLLATCDKTVFFCSLKKPSVSYERIVVVAPLLAELEQTFLLWSERLLRLGKELKIPLVLYGGTTTFERLEKVAQANKIDTDISLEELANLDAFYPSYPKKSSDLIAIVSCRPGSVSFDTQVDQLLQNIEVAFDQNDYILIYPGSVGNDPAFSNYDDINAAPLVAGVETIQKIGREVGSIFRKNK
ncbi:MAG: cation:proton antiporter [Crocinitomicaceae bacterium]|jgi:Kef-type K+ transport system membrane component KefB|nr:cation:proton antiporter [Crocinitomicaceae bacterium]MDP4723807.1 cation:proton antiporter [Crocinitomicaceae bacterium]MDP4739002.1 cation:proton antiporter [Crocinitomicaceae bacterium]MDP4798516.1 cation:proton antiporter [Crocinitomicaceae bacterium]MDP4807103.1 cation:proton antiporter [Crocinitomicaceae bacterium]